MRVAALYDIHRMLVPLAAVLDETAEQLSDEQRGSGWPDAESFAERNLRTAMRREDVVPVFEGFAIDRGER